MGWASIAERGPAVTSDLADDPDSRRAPEGASAATTLAVSVGSEPGCVVLIVEGEVDMASVPTLRTCLRAAITDSNDPVIVDLAAVTFLDSSGIAALGRAHGQLQANARDMYVRNASPMVRRILTVTGLHHILIDHEQGEGDTSA